MELNKRKTASIISFFVAVSLFALEVPSWHNQPVIDKANILSERQEQELDSYLQTVNDQTGVQMAILTINSLGGESLESYSMKVAETWKLGQKGKDNGALLVIAMKEHKVRIEVGYGLEGTLTDIKSGLIIRNVITPQFKKGNYAKGISEGIKNMVGVATNNTDIISENVSHPKKRRDNSDAFASFLFFIIFFGILTSGIGRRTGLLSWLPWVWLFGGHHHNRFYTGHHDHHSDIFGGGGFGDGGGFSGGGFSGGGGSFGGGGASGGW